MYFRRGTKLGSLMRSSGDRPLPDRVVLESPFPPEEFAARLAAVQADHLDVIGHYDDPATQPPHFDWLTTGSSFGTAAFDELWSRVLDFLVGG